MLLLLALMQLRMLCLVRRTVRVRRLPHLVLRHLMVRQWRTHLPRKLRHPLRILASGGVGHGQANVSGKLGVRLPWWYRPSFEAMWLAFGSLLSTFHG